MQLYFNSGEYKDFTITRKVLQYNKSAIDDKNVLIIDVDIPLMGQKYGYLDKDVTTFYLVDRYSVDSFILLDKFPIYVDVLIPEKRDETILTSLSQFVNIAWAALYDDYDEAMKHK